MTKLYLAALVIVIAAALTAVPALANKPPKDGAKCPAGYTDAGLDHGVLLCTKETLREVVVTRDIPGPTVYVDRPIEVIREVQVPGPVQIKVVRGKVKTKIVVRWKTKTKFLRYCPRKPKDSGLTG